MLFLCLQLPILLPGSLVLFLTALRLSCAPLASALSLYALGEPLSFDFATIFRISCYFAPFLGAFLHLCGYWGLLSSIPFASLSIWDTRMSSRAFHCLISWFSFAFLALFIPSLSIC